MTKLFVSALLLTLFPLPSAFAAEEMTADLYTLDGKEKKLTAESKREYTTDTMTYTGAWKNLDGTVAMEEKAVVKAGTLVRYEIASKQTQENGVIEVADGKIIFKYFNGKTQKPDKKEPLSPDTLVGPMLFPFLQSNFSKIQAKEDVKFKYAVWYRQETIGFKFSLQNDEGNSLVVRMAPTNMLYRSLVDPIFITIDKTTQKITSYKGRTSPKITVDGKLKDFDTSIIYNHKEPTVPTTPEEQPAKPSKPAKKK